MVSGFLTSPYDQERIFSGEARPILIESNSSFCVTCLNKSSSDFMCSSFRIEDRGSRSEDRGTGLAQSSILDPQSCFLIPHQIHIDRQGTNFLDDHIEGFRHSGVDLVITLDDALINL